MSGKTKKLIAIISILGLLVFLVPFMMGSLTDEYHETSGSIQINKPIDKAWPILNNPQLSPEISEMVTRVEMQKSKKPGFHIWKEYFDETNYILFETTELEPKKRWVVEISETPLPLDGKWIFEIENATNESFILKITDKGNIRNALFRFISKYIRGYDFILKQTLKSLKTYIEARA